jgi:malonyl CoA-acyl carrier protein transacylase
MGMGLDLYSSSPVACAVWDSADAHLISAYGFSIVGIVRENPKKKTTHFGGVKAHLQSVFVFYGKVVKIDLPIGSVSLSSILPFSLSRSK